ncbi:conjugative transposon protein TraM [Tunicatimonas pelagia]|uniref:conjugative transposon protein TraM n=1 Tax=Tunicatimonas pelagia TaxID=931531 RepID=UPI002665D553|nr:conjugative transposon protein TraM [Tunicatimonas pelagia]WKN44924.1 conjugative transposon protein TraM [Tunicatimonas pelagia]
MKDFNENVDDESIERTGQGSDRFDEPEPPRSFTQKLGKGLARYSLLIIVGSAAVSITFLHFKGRSLWESLSGTPLPSFWLEEEVVEKDVPDKTQVYDETLSQEKEAQKKRQARPEKITKPYWEGYATSDTATIDVAAQQKDTVPVNPHPPKRRRRLLPVKTPPAVSSVPDTVSVAPLSLFQVVRADRASPGTFVRCVVHGDQEIRSNDRIRLRLEEPITLNGQIIPVNTIVYGDVRLSQNRLQISVQRIGPQLASLSVHDHTYHAGIMLDERNNVVQEATQTTAFRQGNQSANRLPTQVASELGRNLLQQSRRRQQTVFLPDGFPLFIHHQNLQ